MKPAKSVRARNATLDAATFAFPTRQTSEDTSKRDMTDEEAYVIQAFGGLLEFAMATYEKLIHTKSSSQSELRRHKSIIEDSFISMGPEMLKACEHMNLPGNRGKQHPRWNRCIRVQLLLKQLLITDLQPSAVIGIYLQEQEKYRAENVK